VSILALGDFFLSAERSKSRRNALVILLQDNYPHGFQESSLDWYDFTLLRMLRKGEIRPPILGEDSIAGLQNGWIVAAVEPCP
jgi:hypothetical protein